MAQPMFAEGRVDDITPEDFGVLVGWMHRDGAQGIILAMQSARSQAAWTRGEIDKRNFLMTRNQALLLARYLLEATGQALDPPERGHGWRKAWVRLSGKR
ncbi:MAG TPA: hypothetical protein VM055_08020 [Novosphingobium sp.]|nr:hypothetical protein [Novosphingobium sp.]